MSCTLADLNVPIRVTCCWCTFTFSIDTREKLIQRTFLQFHAITEEAIRLLSKATILAGHLLGKILIY